MDKHVTDQADSPSGPGGAPNLRVRAAPGVCYARRTRRRLIPGPGTPEKDDKYMKYNILKIFAVAIPLQVILWITGGAAAGSGPSAPDNLTVERIYGKPSLLGTLPSGIQWVGDGKGVSLIEKRGAGDDVQRVFLVREVPSGKEQVVCIPDTAAVPEDLRESDDTRFKIGSYNWDKKGERIAFSFGGEVFTLERKSGRIERRTRTDGVEHNPLFSPDGDKIAYTRDHDLYVLRLEGNEEIRLTESGADTVLNGILDWVYMEELFTRGNKRSFRWSPDSEHLAFLQIRESPVPEFPIVNWMKTGPEPEMQRYPKAGDPNPVVRVGIAPADGGAATTLIVPGMDCSIPSDIAVIKPHDSLHRTRGYIGDTCGNLWRIDYGDASPANWSVTKIAAIGDWSTAAGRRKILYPPDVVFADSYYALLVGTGDREHPFDASVENRFYMFKDHGLIGNPVTANASTVPALSPVGTNAVLGETDLFDITDNCIQEASACPAGVTQADAEASLTAADGWYLALGTGEKSVGTAVTIAGTTFFGTNQPSTASTLGACESDLGIARAYQVSFLNGSAAFEQDGVAGISANDRFGVVPGGGFLPSAVSSTVQLGGVDSDGDGIYEVAPVTKTPVCLGTRCVDAPGNTLQTRVRSFWYKEID